MKNGIIARLAMAGFYQGMVYMAPDAAPQGGAQELTPQAPQGPQGAVEGGKPEAGSVGKVPEKPEAQKAFESKDENFAKNLAEEAKKQPKLEGEDLKKFIAEESAIFKETGDQIKGAAEKSAQRWARWSAQVEMKTRIDGKLNVMGFLDSIWDLLDPSVKLEREDKPGTFYKWSSAEKWGNSAAKTLGAMRLYINKHAAFLYPELVKAAPAPAAGPTEEEKPFIQAAKAVETIHDLKFLPKTKFVQCGEDGLPVEGAKPMDIAEILQSFYNEVLKEHLPKKEGEKEKAAKAEAEQMAEQELSPDELKARIAELQARLEGKAA